MLFERPLCIRNYVHWELPKIFEEGIYLLGAMCGGTRVRTVRRQLQQAQQEDCACGSVEDWVVKDILEVSLAPCKWKHSVISTETGDV